MVPLTVFAFALAHVFEPHLIFINDVDGYDIAALIIVAIGVFLYNWFEERPQEYSVENI